MSPPPPDTDGSWCPIDFADAPAALHTSLAHLYRGEMHRMATWRTRLDNTSHWAILITTGLTTFTLGSDDVPHYVLLLGLAISAMFMFIEARRYQHLHHSKWRLALLEHNYFAALLCPHHAAPEPSWREQLGSDLEQPHYTIRLHMAARLRLRRNYLLLFFFTTGVWVAKLFIHPSAPRTAAELYARLAVGDLFPSWFVLATATAFVILSSALAAITPSEEELENWTRTAQVARSRTRAQGTSADPPGSPRRTS